MEHIKKLSLLYVCILHWRLFMMPSATKGTNKFMLHSYILLSPNMKSLCYNQGFSEMKSCWSKTFANPLSQAVMNSHTKIGGYLSRQVVFYWSFVWKTSLGASPKPHLIFCLRSENTPIKPRRSTDTLNRYERPLAEDSNFFHYDVSLLKAQTKLNLT